MLFCPCVVLSLNPALLIRFLSYTHVKECQTTFPYFVLCICKNNLDLHCLNVRWMQCEYQLNVIWWEDFLFAGKSLSRLVGLLACWIPARYRSFICLTLAPELKLMRQMITAPVNYRCTCYLKRSNLHLYFFSIAQ